jgi:hypothetical protein
MDEMPLSFRNSVSRAIDFVVVGMRDGYASLLEENGDELCAASAVRGLSVIFNHDVWPDDDFDFIDYGDDVIHNLTDWSRPILERYTLMFF